MGKLDCGILVGSNEKMEWLLPWWWERYSAHNQHAVAFADFGLSSKGRAFCQQRGVVIDIDKDSMNSFQSGNKDWAKIYGESYEVARQGWFKKPLALAASPFEITLWTDLDCEILQDLSILFSHVPQGDFLAMAKETSSYDEPFIVYNGGVILFRKRNIVIEAFAQGTKTLANQFWGDDRLLSFLIDQMSYSVTELPDVFNWRFGQGIPAGAFILHWSGEWGKKYIKQLGGIGSFL
jgi:hypothetical protein